MNKGCEVLVGPHIGDLQNASTHETLEWTIDRYEKLFSIQPEKDYGEWSSSIFLFSLR